LPYTTWADLKSGVLGGGRGLMVRASDWDQLIDWQALWPQNVNANTKTLTNLGSLGLKRQALPGSPSAGCIAYDSADDKLKVYNGIAWISPGSQSPWTADVAAAGYNLSGLGNLTLVAGKLITAPGQTRARAYRTTALSIPSSAWAAIALETADADIGAPAGIWSSSTNPERLAVPAGAGGLYLVIGQVTFIPNNTGVRSASLCKNTTTIAQANTPAVATANIGTNVQVSTLAQLGAGDYVALRAFQYSGGGALDAAGAAGISWLSFYKLA
jgi:hypothetical protein